jgi:hypothetical protein
MNQFLIIKYTLLTMVIFYIFFIIYFKLRYPFWSKQPIFYYHDIGNLIYPKGIIETSLPNCGNKINQSIIFKKGSHLSSKEIKEINKLLTNNYMTDKLEKYTPSNNDFIDHLICRNMPSRVSLYYDKQKNQLIGTMTSVYKQMILPSNYLDVGYVDYLCIDENHRGKNIAGKIIENHYIRERYQQKTSVYLFKHEGFSRPFVPLTIYNTYFYKLNLFEKIILTQQRLNISLITKNNISMLYDLQTNLQKNITNKSSCFKCVIMDEFEHLSYLIEKKHIFIFALIENMKPKAFYFFRNNYTTYNDDKSIECFSCIKYDKDIETNKLVLGFYLAIDYLKTIDKYKILILENIADSRYLTKNMDQQPYHYSKYYYYLYNYAMKPIASRNIVII